MYLQINYKVLTRKKDNDIKRAFLVPRIEYCKYIDLEYAMIAKKLNTSELEEFCQHVWGENPKAGRENLLISIGKI